MAKVATTVTLDEKECRDAIYAAAKKAIGRDVDTGNGGNQMKINIVDNKIVDATLEYHVK